LNSSVSPDANNLPATTGSVAPGSQTQTKASSGFSSEVIFGFGFGSVNGFWHQGDQLVVGGNGAGYSLLIEIEQPDPGKRGSLGNSNILS